MGNLFFKTFILNVAFCFLATISVQGSVRGKSLVEKIVNSNLWYCHANVLFSGNSDISLSDAKDYLFGQSILKCFNLTNSKDHKFSTPIELILKGPLKYSFTEKDLFPAQIYIFLSSLPGDFSGDYTVDRPYSQLYNNQILTIWAQTSFNTGGYDLSFNLQVNSPLEQAFQLKQFLSKAVLTIDIPESSKKTERPENP